MWVSHTSRACVRACVCVCVCVRLTGDQAVTGFALPVQHHSKVEFGHEIFSTVIPIPSYSKKCSCRYWQNLTLRLFVDLTIKQLVDGSI